MEIRRGTPEDFGLVMERVLASFREHNPTHGRFEDMYPDSVTPESMSQWHLAEVDGEIAAGIQLVPRSFVCAGTVRLPGMGLGNVFCYPPFRGRGLMSHLLRCCIADMEENGIGVCLLGGDRTRYGNFGWEYAGSDRSLTLSARVGRFDQDRPRVSAMDLRAWNGEETDVVTMLRAYSELPYRTERTALEFGRVVRRPGQVVWLCERGEEGFAYVSVRGSSILEYAGDAAALEVLVTYLLQNGTWRVSLPPVEGQGPLEKLLLTRAQHYGVQPTGMIRLISLKVVLTAYLPLLRYRLQGWEGELVLRAKDNGESVGIVSEGGGLEVRDAAADAPAIELSRRELAQLFFGPFPPDLGEGFRHSGVRRLFPLPLHWHALAHV